MIKGIYKISKVNIILNGKVLNDFFQSKDVHSIFIQKVLEVLAYATGKGKKCRDWKYKMRSSLFTGDIILYIENHTESL